MITINQPYIYKSDSGARLESIIQDSSINREYKIWYEVDEECSQYLCSELADAFLLTVIPFAVKRAQDIYVDANVSPQLLYNARNCHIPFYAALFSKRRVELKAASSEPVSFSGEAIGTGCSMGVDSLSTIFKHTGDDCLPEYRLTHLTLFNACQFGVIKQDELEKDMAEAAERSRQLADELGLKFITVNSNIVELLEDSGIDSTQVCPIFTISCAMAIQKLFKKYLYSSSYNAGMIRIEEDDASHTEAAYVPLLGNENVQIVLSDTFARRTEKTAYIIKNPLTKKYLNVCGATYMTKAERIYDWFAADKRHLNCGWCDKCMRTLLTIELMGNINDYQEIFNLDKYYEYRADYIAKLTAKSKHDVYCAELYELLQEKNVRVPLIGKAFRSFDVVNSKFLTSAWQKYQKIRRTLQ